MSPQTFCILLIFSLSLEKTSLIVWNIFVNLRLGVFLLLLRIFSSVFLSVTFLGLFRTLLPVGRICFLLLLKADRFLTSSRDPYSRFLPSSRIPKKSFHSPCTDFSILPMSIIVPFSSEYLLVHVQQ
ncbi:hypothetical protein WN66_04664 [Saccharomyces cerevisiae]|uniref:EC1118_1L7_3466p n=1 Tax=Saccharomyces cerevisiae (strain Lalvin EC1118 / Prise de mousse) TaxID=643680 RepID=C8ZE64_YEAS8|nr:hypothetical protein WN66_04664 [Saccharomyces cerevisiae]CAY81680.1 EC1118_1L7_3466p [Saccharomyces cerevisiae EC1118]